MIRDLLILADHGLTLLARKLLALGERLLAEHDAVDLGGEDAYCAEEGCTRLAVTSRPSRGAWLVDDGVVIDADELVCSEHQEGTC